MRSISTGLVSVCLLLTGVAASAQINFSVQVQIPMCTLLPQEMQIACSGDLSNEKSARAVLGVCNAMYSGTNRAQCLTKVNAGTYSTTAVNACAATWLESDRVACLDIIRDSYYQKEALNICKSMYSGTEFKNCLATVKNKVFASYETASCAGEWLESSRTNCLNTLGRRLDLQLLSIQPRRYDPNAQFPRPIAIQPRQNTTIVIRNNPVIYQAPIVREETCNVHNSSGSLGKTVAKKSFMNYAAEVARNEDSCVVAHYFDQDFSRSLFSKSGVELRSKMSEAEATAEKKSYGYNRCKVLICR